MTDAIGIAAATLTTAAFVPQLLRVWRTRSVDDLSLLTLLVFIASVGLWLVYGIRARMLPIILANAITLALNLGILAVKLRHGRRPG